MKNYRHFQGAAGDGPVCACWLASAAMASLLWPAIACAASLTPVTVPAVGSSIYDPNTGTNETVVNPPSQFVGTPFVQVSNGDVIFVANTVDDSFTGSNGDTYYVSAVTSTCRSTTSG